MRRRDLFRRAVAALIALPAGAVVVQTMKRQPAASEDAVDPSPRGTVMYFQGRIPDGWEPVEGRTGTWAISMPEIPRLKTTTGTVRKRWIPNYSTIQHSDGVLARKL